MLVGEKTVGSLFRDTINRLIDTDVRFSEIPDELAEEVGSLDEVYEGDVEVYKYNVKRDVF